MTLKEFNEELNKELGKFYKAKDEYVQKQKDSVWKFKHKVNVPFIQQKEYLVGDYLFFIGTNCNMKYHIGKIGDISFRNFFSSDEMAPYLDEEMEIAIAKMSIDYHKKSAFGIENSDIETKTRYQKEFEWHQNEIEKLQNIVDALQEGKEVDIER